MQLFHVDRNPFRDHSRDLYLSVVDPLVMPKPGAILEDGNEWFDAMKQAFALGFYKHVADIEGDDMDYVWHHTQHADRPWHKELAKGITLATDDDVESTSIGDIIEKDGIYFVAGRFGFHALSWFEPKLDKAPASEGPKP